MQSTEFNTVILLKGTRRFTKKMFSKFTPGDTIYGLDSDPEEIMRWPIEKEEEAKAELTKHFCEYRRGLELVDVEEYGLEYCYCDEDGDFIEGSNYDLAEEYKR